MARLRLLKQLTDQVHAIGAVGALLLDEPQAMQARQTLSPRVPPTHGSASPWRVVAMIRSMAHKLCGIVASDLLAVHDDLDSACGRWTSLRSAN